MTVVAILVKASLLIAAAASTHALAGRRMSAAMRHQLWTLAGVSLLLLPILALALPSWTVIRLDRAAPVVAPPIAGFSAPDSETDSATPIASTTRDTSADNGVPRDSWITGIPRPGALAPLYATGVLLLLVRLAFQFLVLSRISRRATVAGEEWERLGKECAQQLGVRRPVRLFRSVDGTIPMAFGIVKAAILIPAIGDTWDADRRRAVLLHELAHVARNDCFTQMLATVACAIYWVHPGAWWMARRLRVERELACDDLVLSTGTCPRDYAGHLLEIAYALRTTFAPALSVSMASPRQLEGRMLALLDAARNRATPTHRTRLAATLLMVACLVSVAAATATLDPAPAVVVDASFDAADAPNAPAIAGAPAQATAPSNRQSRPGTWEIRPVPESGIVHLRMSESDGYYRRNIEIERLSGLAPSLLTGSGGSAGFSVRHDAGTFTFEGLFHNGVGAGTYTFTPNAGFADVMVTRGYERPTTDQLRALARQDVGVAFLDELTSQGYRRPTLAQIIRATEHSVDTSFLRDLGRLGYRVGSIDALIDMRDHGVSPEFIRGLAAEGLVRLSAEDLVKVRDHGVSPEYVREMRNQGYTLTIDELIRARDHGVSLEFVREMRNQGYTLAIDELVRARDHGVSAEYVVDMRNQGYALTIEELVRARDHGVSIEFVRDLRALGYEKLPIDSLVRLRDHGVSPGYIKDLGTIGYPRLGIEDLVSLRSQGVSADEVRRANARAGSRLSVERLRELAARGWR